MVRDEQDRWRSSRRERPPGDPTIGYARFRVAGTGDLFLASVRSAVTA